MENNKVEINILEILQNVILEKYNLERKDLKLEIPPKKEFGDFAFGGFQLARDLKKNPNLIVEELKEFLENKKNDLIESLEIAGPYLNIKVNKLNTIKDFLENPHSGISSPLGEKEAIKKGTIVVDYIGANVGKPMHIGHMCTPNQGQAMINIYKKLGYNVISDSHIGDWGIIFGKLILAYKKWGSEEKLKQNAVEHLLELYIKITEETENDNKIFSWNLTKIYEDLGKKKLIPDDFPYYKKVYMDRNIEGYNKMVSFYIEKFGRGNLLQFKGIEEQIRQEFKKLSEGNKESIKYWESFTRESIKAMNVLLERMNVKPMYNIGESFYEGLGLPKMEDYPDLEYSMKDIVKELIEKGIATKNEDGSVGVVFDEHTKIPSCILQKRDGTHGYLASDLAAVKYRVSNWNPEKIIYFVDSRQQLHLKQVFEISHKAGWIDKEKLFHAYNGFISLKDGAMSTRKGRIIKLKALLGEAEDRAKKIILEKRDDIKGEELESLAKIIGIGAIKYGYLKKNRETDVIFDWDEFMSFEGNSGPYIQYAYVRAINILKKSDISFENINLEKIDAKFLKEETLNLIKNLMKYKEILLETASKNMPHILANYAYEITKIFNNFYNNVEVLSESEEEIKKLNLKVVKEFSEILKESFELLGIKMPEKM